MKSNNLATKEVDLLVLGAGPAGMSAALSGSLHKLNVLLCEKSKQVGGTAATSAGTLWIPENSQNIKAGFTSDSKNAARLYLENLICDPEHGKKVREQFLEQGPNIIDWFEKNTEVKFLPCGNYPDYLDLDGAAVSGRAIIPQPFDGRLLGKNFSRVRPPIPEYMIFSGMMVGKVDIPYLVNRFKSVRNFLYAGRLFLRYVTDRLFYPRGTRLTLGNALVARLYQSLILKKVEILFETQLEELTVKDGKVVGAIVLCGAQKMQIYASRGIILATGGFGRNKTLRKSFMSVNVNESMAVPENLGEGIVAAQRVGAQVCPEKHGSGAFWTPVSKTGGSRWAGLYPHLALDRAKPGLIAINGRGVRFVNEAVSYHHFVLAMLDSHKHNPSTPTWLICEASFIYKYGLGAIHPGTRNLKPYVHKKWISIGQSIKCLAEKIGVPALTLEETVERHNQFSKTGIDLDFAKGSTNLNRYNGDPTHTPNPCIGEIKTGPFCAMAVWPAELGTSTGLESDEFGRVLNQNGDPLTGLYVCGNDMSSIMQGTYPGPGTTLGPALVFGYLAAKHASESNQRNSYTSKQNK